MEFPALNRLKKQQVSLESLLADANSPDYSTIKKHNKDIKLTAKEWQDNIVKGNGARLDAVYKSLGQFLYDVRTFPNSVEARERLQKYENELKATVPEYVKKAFPSGMNETVLSDGGALIPPQYVNEILMRTYSNELLSRVRMFNQLSSNKLKIPAIDETSRANGSRFGGVTSYRRQEGPPSALTSSKPKLSLLELSVEPLYVYVRTTDELLEDYVALESFMGDIVAQEFQFKLGDELVNGDGVGKFQGLLNSGSKKTITKETGQAAATIVPENIWKMWSGMWVGSRPNGVWLIHSTVWEQLLSLTQGQHNLFLPANSAIGNLQPLILGQPCIETEFNAVLGTEGDIIFVDLSTYLVAQKGDTRSFSSMHVYFDTAEHAFRYEMRNDGKSWWKTALTNFKGGGTSSNIITLGTRS